MKIGKSGLLLALIIGGGFALAQSYLKTDAEKAADAAASGKKFEALITKSGILPRTSLAARYQTACEDSNARLSESDKSAFCSCMMSGMSDAYYLKLSDRQASNFLQAGSLGQFPNSLERAVANNCGASTSVYR